jgi:hypothetical protein
MSCEQYHIEITAALARGGELPRSLRGHLESCARCREALEQERALFGAMDIELRERVNADLPAGFTARVRARIAEQPVSRRAWVPLWAALTGSAALAVTLFIAPGVWREAPDHASRVTAKQEQKPPRIGEVPASIPGSHQAAAPPLRRPVVRGGPQVRRKLQPEVLVAEGEEQVLQNYVRMIRRHNEMTEALREPIRGPLQIAPLEVSQLEIKPLDAAEASPENRK